MLAPARQTRRFRPRREVAWIATGVALWLVTPRDAQAYLDPMTGNALIQIVLATVLGSLFAIKMYWRKLKAYFTGRPVQQAEEHQEASAADDPPR